MASNSYFDAMLESMLADKNQGQMSYNEMFDARSAAGRANEDMMRYKMGSKRKRKKKGGDTAGEPGWVTSMARFPGIEGQILSAEAGFLPRGVSWRSLLGEDLTDTRNRQGEQNRWAKHQRGVLGMTPESLARRY